jgi:JmjC domain, hydroxylase
MHSLKEFVAAAKRWKAEYCKATGLPSNPSAAQIEAEFWKLLGPDPPLPDAAPLYGSDLDTSIVGSGFPTLESILAAAAVAAAADSPPRSRRNSNSSSKSSSTTRSPASAAAAATAGSNCYASPGSKRPRQAHSMSPAQGLQGGWVPSVSPVKKEELLTAAAAAAAAAVGGVGVKAEYQQQQQQLPQPEVDVYADHDYASDPWNLNLLPLAGSSLLRHLGRRVTGCMVPWLYVGSMFSAFCWHNEDHFLYSINYHHFGAPKVSL